MPFSPDTMNGQEEFWGDSLDESADEDCFSSHNPPTCKYCSTPNLKWSCVTGKWRLYDKNGLHVCPPTTKGLTPTKPQ